MTYAPPRPIAHPHRATTAPHTQAPFVLVQMPTEDHENSPHPTASCQADQPLLIDVSPRNGYTLVHLAGELDIATVKQAGDTLRSLLTGGSPRLVLDLSDLTFIECMGIAELKKASRLAEENGGWLRLVRSRDNLLRLLFALDLTDQLPVYDSVTAAANAAAEFSAMLSYGQRFRQSPAGRRVQRRSEMAHTVARRFRGAA